VSRHWRPPGKIVRIRPVRQGPWTRADEYLGLDTAGPRKIVPVVVSAVVVGLAAGGFLSWTARNADSGPSAAIEWNAVQAVPTRTPDAEDLAWANRAAGQDGAASASEPTEDARATAVRAAFGYCYSGGGTNCVVDGDTFWIGGEKVRIAGIDAPETHPPRCADEARLGNAATERLHALLNSGAVTMTSIDRDRDVYGRLLRNVSVNGSDVGEAMVSAGVAREYGGGRRAWC
jgi:micrococcal nuclease